MPRRKHDLLEYINSYNPALKLDPCLSSIPVSGRQKPDKKSRQTKLPSPMFTGRSFCNARRGCGAPGPGTSDVGLEPTRPPCIPEPPVSVPVPRRSAPGSADLKKEGCRSLGIEGKRVVLRVRSVGDIVIVDA